MALSWQDLPDTPENRALVLRAHHVTDWSIEEMETARLGRSRRLREREDPRAPSIRRLRPGRRR